MLGLVLAFLGGIVSVFLALWAWSWYDDYQMAKRMKKYSPRDWPKEPLWPEDEPERSGAPWCCGEAMEYSKVVGMDDEILGMAWFCNCCDDVQVDD
jgi:hypothetical protein